MGTGLEWRRRKRCLAHPRRHQPRHHQQLGSPGGDEALLAWPRASVHTQGGAQTKPSAETVSRTQA